jgi:hypothetical protein
MSPLKNLKTYSRFAAYFLAAKPSTLTILLLMLFLGYVII